MRNPNMTLTESLNSDTLPKKKPSTRNNKLLKSTVPRASSAITAYKKQAKNMKKSSRSSEKMAAKGKRRVDSSYSDNSRNMKRSSVSDNSRNKK